MAAGKSKGVVTDGGEAPAQEHHLPLQQEHWSPTNGAAAGVGFLVSTMAATAYGYTYLPSLSSTPTVKTRNRFCSIPCTNFFRPNLGSFKSYRLKISHNLRKTSNCLFESESSASNGSSPEVTIDIELPRRSLLVQFTCDACGERSQKLINRLAYEKGTVFVQCSGCFQYHKLVDNLHLVVEYDFREDVDADSKADQV